jgi:hypothetical protein
VRTFTVDVAGRRSPVTTSIYRIDRSAPLATVRTFPPAAASMGWFRHSCAPSLSMGALTGPDVCLPQLVLRAVDGDQSSGLAQIQYKLDTDPAFRAYSGPVTIPEGVRSVSFFATDNAGNVAPTQTLTVPVDVTPPVVIATNPDPALWLQLLGILGNFLGFSPPQAKLQWVVSDNLSHNVQVTVLVYNVAGAVVRQLDAGKVAVTPGQPTSGFTYWDGKDQTLTGIIPIGLYYYRVVAIDEAGNVAQSGESKPIQIKASL